MEVVFYYIGVKYTLVVFEFFLIFQMSKFFDKSHGKYAPYAPSQKLMYVFKFFFKIIIKYNVRGTNWILLGYPLTKWIEVYFYMYEIWGFENLPF